MNRLILGLVIGLAVGGATVGLVMHRAAPPAASVAGAANTDADEDEASDAKPTSAPGDAAERHWSAAQRAQAGITLVAARAVTLPPEVEASGRVLDPGSLAGFVAEIDTARAALGASEAELTRAEKLFAAGGNASAQTVETARANAARDRASLTSAESRLEVTWGGDVARRAEAILATVRGGGALVRIDLLPGIQAAAAPREAQAGRLGAEAMQPAEILGPAPAVEAELQGMSFLALLPAGAPPVGAMLRARLPGPGGAAVAVAIPRSAVVYHQGAAWVFVAGAEDTFQRRLVTLGRGLGADDIAVLDGLKAGESVAATGAEQLLAAGLLAGGTPMEER